MKVLVYGRTARLSNHCHKLLQTLRRDGGKGTTSELTSTVARETALKPIRVEQCYAK